MGTKTFTQMRDRGVVSRDQKVKAIIASARGRDALIPTLDSTINKVYQAFQDPNRTFSVDSVKKILASLKKSKFLVRRAYKEALQGSRVLIASGLPNDKIVSQVEDLAALAAKVDLLRGQAVASLAGDQDVVQLDDNGVVQDADDGMDSLPEDALDAEDMGDGLDMPTAGYEDETGDDPMMAAEEPDGDEVTAGYEDETGDDVTKASRRRSELARRRRSEDETDVEAADEPDGDEVPPVQASRSARRRMADDVDPSVDTPPDPDKVIVDTDPVKKGSRRRADDVDPSVDAPPDPDKTVNTGADDDMDGDADISQGFEMPDAGIDDVVSAEFLDDVPEASDDMDQDDQMVEGKVAARTRKLASARVVGGSSEESDDLLRQHVETEMLG